MKSSSVINHLENITMNAFGRSRVLSIAGNSCVVCGKASTNFKDEVSRKEFSVSGMCQTCQDSFFDDQSED